MDRHNLFKMPYMGIDAYQDIDLLYGLNAEFSVVIRVTNPVLQFSGAASAYHQVHSLYNNLLKIIGSGHILQKLDVLAKSIYPYHPSEHFLQDEYNRHFQGRAHLQIHTYLVVTRLPKKGLYQYDPKSLREFSQMTDKLVSVLQAGDCKPVLLKEPEINLLVKQLLSMNFSGGTLSLDNISPGATQIDMGDRSMRCISLVDIDAIALPAQLSPDTTLGGNEALRGFPVDLISFLTRVPGADCIVFNQLIEITEQSKTIGKLTLKRKRHSGIPDPANLLCVEDIDALLKDVARYGQLLVNAHFNILVCAAKESLQSACNFIENELFQIGITPGRNSYNQLELFRTLLPGNGAELKDYDWFLTTCDAALCLLFKESLPVDEPSDFRVRFTDRMGIPVAIGISDIDTGRMTNRSRFCLGPSGSGKSYFINNLVEQYLVNGMDVVIVDTGHSYSGLCAYYGGKYITYTQEQPIAMNPFAVSQEELNIEKKDFLVTLVLLLWKGADGLVNTVERDIIAQLISGYYAAHFTAGIAEPEFESWHDQLSFNSFYDFAIARIPLLKAAEGISFNYEEFRYVLKKYYRGGIYDTVLNETAQESLLATPFVIFEIDSIKESKVLFPIVTLIIMDVFLQKMRQRNCRKALIIEEAWKAVASPLMAGYLVFMYKTVRKFYGEVIVVTQELGDILGNETVKDSILANSDTVCLLDQRKFRDNYDQIAALLSLSETERRKIFTINQLDNTAGRGKFREVYIKRGGYGEVYGVEVSLSQYLCYTTEKPEKAAVEVYAGVYPAYPDALRAFVADLKASDLSLGRFVAQVNQLGKPYSLKEVVV